MWVTAPIGLLSVDNHFTRLKLQLKHSCPQLPDALCSLISGFLFIPISHLGLYISCNRHSSLFFMLTHPDHAFTCYLLSLDVTLALVSPVS